MESVTLSGRPAIAGGKPAFTDALPFNRPDTAVIADAAMTDIKDILATGMLSNVNHWVRRFEDRAADLLDIPNPVAVSTCTSGLILVLQALGGRGGKVALPSFTFDASAHAAYWAGATPWLLDADPNHWTMDVQQSAAAADEGASALLATHTFGNPADVTGLQKVAASRDIPLVFDAAHALGGSHAGQPVGSFGDAEVFSLSPTKLVTTLEGGLIATKDDELAERLRLLRNYGNLPDYRCPEIGLNARMSEVNACIGYHMLPHLQEWIQTRNHNAALMRDRLGRLSGVSFQAIDGASICTYKDLTFAVDAEGFGMNRDELTKALAAEGIPTKPYFHPAIHQLDAYRDAPRMELTETERLTSSVIAIPAHNRMDDAIFDRMIQAVERIHQGALN